MDGGGKGWGEGARVGPFSGPGGSPPIPCPMAWGEGRCPASGWAPRPGGEAEALLRGLRAGGGGRFGVTWGKVAGGGADGRFPPAGVLGGFVGGAPPAPEPDIEMGLGGWGCCLPPLRAPTEAAAPPPLGPTGGPDRTPPPAPPG